MNEDLNLALLNLYEACLQMRASNKVGLMFWKKNFVRPWDKFYDALEQVEQAEAKAGKGLKRNGL